MKLKKILDYDALQGYRINSPSKRFKTMFPKKYIFVISINNQIMFANVDSIPAQFAFMPIIGYVFTYEKSLPDLLKSNKYIKYQNYCRTCPVGLDQFFINNAEGKVICDLVIRCTATNEIMPVQMTEPLIIRCNSHQLVGEDSKTISDMVSNIKLNIKKIVTSMLKLMSPNSAEEWLISVIEKGPLNNNEFPFRYPDSITDSLFKSKTINYKNSQIGIAYDLRADSYEFESDFIHAMELAYENMNQKIIIYDTYNGLLRKVVEGLEKRKLKYEANDDNSIEVKLKDIWALDDLEFQITDLI